MLILGRGELSRKTDNPPRFDADKTVGKEITQRK